MTTNICVVCGCELDDDPMDHPTDDGVVCEDCYDSIIERLNEEDEGSGFNYVNEYRRCPDCNGTGYEYLTKQCERCGGSGEI